MQRVEIRPLRLRELAVFRLEEVDPHPLAAVEMQVPAVIPGDAKIVKVRFVVDLDRAVEEDFSVLPERRTMPERCVRLRIAAPRQVLFCH